MSPLSLGVFSIPLLFLALLGIGLPLTELIAFALLVSTTPGVKQKQHPGLPNH
jgi:hypothetical protein